MQTKGHIITGGGIGLVLLIISFFSSFWNAIQSLIFFLWSVALDLDHFIEILGKVSFKHRSPIRVIKARLKASKKITENFQHSNIRKDFLIFEPLHTVEFLALIFVSILLSKGFLSKILIAVFCSTILHFFLDLIDSKRTKLPRAWSFIYYYLFQRKKIRKMGLDPNLKEKLVIKITKQELEN